MGRHFIGLSFNSASADSLFSWCEGWSFSFRFISYLRFYNLQQFVFMKAEVSVTLRWITVSEPQQPPLLSFTFSLKASEGGACRGVATSPCGDWFWLCSGHLLPVRQSDLTTVLTSATRLTLTGHSCARVWTLPLNDTLQCLIYKNSLFFWLLNELFCAV